MKVDRRDNDDRSRPAALMNDLGHIARESLGWLVRLIEENQWWEYEYDQQQAEEDEQQI